MDKKDVLVTGSSSGIGLAISLLFLQKGYRVFGLSRKDNCILSKYENFSYIKCDVSQKTQVENAYNIILDSAKKLDIVVHCAGIALGDNEFEDGLIEDFIEMINVNVFGSVFVFKIFLPLLQNSAQANLISIGSIASNYQYRTGHIYAATKAFLEHLVYSIRTELQSSKLNITLISPGRVETNFDINRYKNDTKKANFQIKNKPYLQVEDITNLISWIVEQDKSLNLPKIEIVPSNGVLSYQ